ncbi:4784_t:CDS:2 [Acaulospora colombiana]|uniref:4784_t:CDS:1 n=1 Tax=Acaulospora colombiana TaxID=27376 RepID=A0ACA9LT19_9GLOM|nr:4784_t:CDS:2 [Acaulospora colombiana]
MSENRAFDNFSDPKTLVTSKKQNALDIYCPQSSCKCLILRANIGTLVERPKEKLTLPKGQNKTQPSEISETSNKNEKKVTEGNNKEGNSSQLQGFWQLTDLMAFENIGFSKTIIETGVKYICCADCNTGPLGYHDTVAKEVEYLIAVDKVSYAVIQETGIEA